MNSCYRGMVGSSLAPAVRGKPLEVLPMLVEQWGVTHLSFEADTEPYATKRDKEVHGMKGRLGITVGVLCSAFLLRMAPPL